MALEVAKTSGAADGCLSGRHRGWGSPALSGRLSVSLREKMTKCVQRCLAADGRPSNHLMYL